MDLQNKYQILATEFSKVRGQVTVLKKAVIDEQTKNQQLQEDINRKDQNLRRNAQEIETLTFLNTQLKSRLEILQKELQEHENHGRSKKNSGNKNSTFISYHDDVLSQELELKIKQYEVLHRRVNELEKQVAENEAERAQTRSTIEDLHNQMIVMQDGHHRARDEYERIIKQVKQENDLLNEQIKQHLSDRSQNVPSRKHSSVNPTGKLNLESRPNVQTELFLYQYLTAWKDGFTELIIYIEERFRNNQKPSENDEKMVQTTKEFQQHADKFLLALKSTLFHEKTSEKSQDPIDFSDLFSTFISTCEQILSFAMKSICDEPKGDATSESQERIYSRIHKLNGVLDELLKRWANNLSKLKGITIEILRLDLTDSNENERIESKIGEIVTKFQEGSLIHCDLDKTYNDKLCLEYELERSPVHLTTTDECILASLRKLASLEQQIGQLIRDNQSFVTDFQHRRRILSTKERSSEQTKISDDPNQEYFDNQTKEFLSNAEAIGSLEQEKEHWRLEYQLLKIKFEKMRDDFVKEIDSWKEKTNQTTSNSEQIEEMISTTTTTMTSANQSEKRDDRTYSEPPSERELLMKQYYSQKVLELENRLQLANGKGIAFYNELANIHQRLKHSKDQEAKWKTDIESLNNELVQMKDELATTTKIYEEQIGTMSEHLASMNEQLTTQNEFIDKLQQQIHSNPKDGKKNKK